MFIDSILRNVGGMKRFSDKGKQKESFVLPLPTLKEWLRKVGRKGNYKKMESWNIRKEERIMKREKIWVNVLSFLSRVF